MSSADSPAPENKLNQVWHCLCTDNYKALLYNCVSLLPRPRSQKSRRGLGRNSEISPYPPVYFSKGIVCAKPN